MAGCCVGHGVTDAATASHVVASMIYCQAEAWTSCDKTAGRGPTCAACGVHQRGERELPQISLDEVGGGKSQAETQNKNFHSFAALAACRACTGGVGLEEALKVRFTRPVHRRSGSTPAGSARCPTSSGARTRHVRSERSRGQPSPRGWTKAPTAQTKPAITRGGPACKGQQYGRSALQGLGKSHARGHD